MAKQEQQQQLHTERSMEARVGRDNQRYSPDGARLVAGVVPLSSDKKQVLLIQSSARKGWVLPKGGWETDEPTAAEAALREAWEEAGIECDVERDLGDIVDSRPAAAIARAAVTGAPRASYRFFEVRVRAQLDGWPEAHKRNRCWVSYAEARVLLRERPELVEALDRSSIVR